MTRLLTTSEVAAQLRTSPEFVRDHAAELGAIRLGKKHSPLRFPEEGVDKFVERRRLRVVNATRRSLPGPQRADGVKMLPLPKEVA